jgi:hypothetical protein
LFLVHFSSHSMPLRKLSDVAVKWFYIPIYSHIYHGDKEKHPLNLTATLSIRNTDADYPVTITVIRYYDSGGKLLKSYLRNSLTLNPLSSTRVVIQESDKSGGSGASFIVT